MSRKRRSATVGSGCAGLPDRSASTPITNGSSTFLAEPYSSTSYSICTRGARLRAMNFCALALAMGVSWVRGWVNGLLRGAGALQLPRFGDGVGGDVAQQRHEVHLDPAA